MFKKRFSMMTVLVACLCAIVVTLGAIFYSMERITGDALGSLKFLKTLVLVREKFVEQPSDGKLFDGAATGLVEALDDPYSVYLDQQSFKDISNAWRKSRYQSRRQNSSGRWKKDGWDAA